MIKNIYKLLSTGSTLYTGYQLLKNRKNLKNRIKNYVSSYDKDNSHTSR